MKSTSTSHATRGRKSSSGSTSKNQHKTGGRSSSGSQQGNSGSRQGSRQGSSRQSESGTRGNSRSADTGRKTSTAARGSSVQGSNHQGSFKGESHLEKFFLDQLQDIYYAENKITQSLPKMADAATTGELKEAFEDNLHPTHCHQTQRHIKRLEKAFESIGKKAEGKKCEAIEGIAREVENIIDETEEGTLTRDAALIIAAQKVEHYEIATYGGLVQLAITMDLHDAADLLDKTLVEEEDTDARLTEIAENEINLRAEHEDDQDSWNNEGEEKTEAGEEEDGDEESLSVQ